MKKVFFAALMAVVALGASAQVEQGLRFGVQAFGGANSILEDGAKAGVSYGGGVIAEYNFDQNLYLASGLNLQNKSWKGDDELMQLVAGGKSVNSYYLTLPVHVGYRVYINRDETTSIHFEGGPQLGYGLFGTDVDIAGLGMLVSEYGDWCKRFEVGAGIKIGFEFNKFQVNMSTNYGFTNCMKGDVGNNLDATLGVAYMF